MSIYLRNIIRFISLILIQVLLLSNIHLNAFGTDSYVPDFTPFIYPLIILLLPLSTPTWAMLLLGFGTGLTMDVFMNTGGMHAAICVFIAMVRNSILTALLPQRLSDYPNLSPGVKNMGWAPYLTYTAVILLIHHFCYYLIEVWSLRSFLYLILKVLASMVTSIIFVVLYTFLFANSSGSNSLND